MLFSWEVEDGEVVIGFYVFVDKVVEFVMLYVLIVGYEYDLCVE